MNERITTKESLIGALLEDNENSFSLLSELTFEGIIIHRQGEVVVVNNRFVEIFGYADKDEIIGENLIEKNIRPDFRALVYSKAKQEYTGKYEVEAINARGELMHIEIEGHGFKYNGEALRVAAVRDITEQKESEKTLQELIDTKDKFFSIISHDLRSPFHALMGYIGLLKLRHNKMSEEERTTVLNALDESTKQTYKLLENLLTWSKTQNNTITFSPIEQDLSVVIYDSILEVLASAKQKNIEINPKLEEKVRIPFDKEMIKTTMRNLLSNAIKFTPDNGNIRVELKKTEEGVSLTIIDSGVGMTEDQKEHLFNLGKKVSTDGTNGETGSGLGLLLSKEFIDRHKGTILVNSEPGKGTEITFTIGKDL